PLGQFRGSKSRNKVSVGEPAEGSLVNLAQLLATRDPTLYTVHSLAERKIGTCTDSTFCGSLLNISQSM
ncbi:hypothetical protein, partial [Klebsiella pneumoniae]|uniref:hypothetical protein n=1 Tax=Klebsiella pneumoniae TaxID=573 RepID=UPI0019530CDA